jgi:hypothetical protein
VARGGIVRSMEEALEIVRHAGYPLVAKPDIGVGAAATYKIQNEDELGLFFKNKPPVDYVFEAFVRGQIFTFDGLTDRDGTPVFTNSMVYSKGIMETVLEDDLVYYYTLRDIPADLDVLVRLVLAAFDVRERFFHFEFFRQEGTGDLLALEVNLRPPGGLTTDMFNYACDFDIYNGWASILAGKGFPYPDYTHEYFCCYASRKNNRLYAHSEQEILATFGECVRHHEPISGIFSRALGDYGYIVRSPDLDEIVRMAEYIQA